MCVPEHFPHWSTWICIPNPTIILFEMIQNHFGNPSSFSKSSLVGFRNRHVFEWPSILRPRYSCHRKRLSFLRQMSICKCQSDDYPPREDPNRMSLEIVIGRKLLVRRTYYIYNTALEAVSSFNQSINHHSKYVAFRISIINVVLQKEIHGRKISGIHNHF